MYKRVIIESKFRYNFSIISVQELYCEFVWGLCGNLCGGLWGVVRGVVRGVIRGDFTGEIKCYHYEHLSTPFFE